MALIYDGTSGITFNDGSQMGTANQLGIRNRIINGAMVIDQRNAGASVTPTDQAYTLDRWQAQVSQTSKLTVQQNAGSVTPPVGFTNYLGVTSSSAYSITSTDYFNITQNIEGFNTADLAWGTANAKTVTLSAWVYSSLTGTFGGALRNSAVNRSYPFTYTISSANTWTQVNITIVGDTTGTWLTTNGKGISVLWNLGTGSTYSGTAGSWAGANYVSATGATSVVGTNNATFYLTGVQLEKGSVATPFDFRFYGKELLLCQRYYAKMISSTAVASFGSGYVNSSTQALYYLKYPMTMRSAPTFSYSNIAIDSQPATPTVTSAGTTYAGTDTLSVVLNASGGGLTTGQATVLRGTTTTSYVDFSSEL